VSDTDPGTARCDGELEYLVVDEFLRTLIAARSLESALELGVIDRLERTSGVDVDGIERRPERPAGAKVRVGTVARLEHVKGVDVLVRAASVLSSQDLPDHEILVWGEGRERQELVDLTARLDVGHRVRFVGTEQPVEEFLGSLDVYTQPSRNEGMGRALVLAQAAGLPVAASSVCGIPDVVRDGETGLLVPPDQPEALAGAIARFVRDPSTRDGFGDAARSWIMSHDETGYPRFSTAAMLWRLEALYQQLSEDR